MTQRNISAIVAHDAGLPSGWVADHMPAGSGIAVSDFAGALYPPTDEVQNSDADVLLVACSQESDEAVELVVWWTKHRPGRPVVVLCRTSANGFVKRAFDAGADDLVVLDSGQEVSAEMQTDVIFAVQKAVARKSGSGDNGHHRGSMICMLGPKGGVGKTLTSCNLAVSLAVRGKRVVLVDLDLQFGDVALSLGLTPSVTIFDLATAGGSIDAEMIDAFLATHSSGVRVLIAPIRPDHATIITTSFLADVYATLRSDYDYVIIDTPPTFTPEVIAAIDASTHVCMVGMLDALSLKNTKLGLETLELMGYDPEHIRVVLNRANTNVGINGTDVLSILGRSPDVEVPSHRDVPRSVNEGIPIALSQKHSDTARSFDQLAEMYAPPTPRAGKRRRLSLRSKSPA